MEKRSSKRWEVTTLPEGVRPYPKWEGVMSSGSPLMVIMGQEIRKAYLNLWSKLALVFILAYTVIFLGSLYTLSQSDGNAVHTMENYLEFLNNLRWGALALAATMGGPALLEDARRGALELYFSRAVTAADYIAGKILAVFVVTTFGLFVPGILYWMAGFLFFSEQPEQWATVLGPTFLYSVMWGLLVSGLALGLSSVARSSRGATLILLGGFAVLEIFIGNLLEGITRDGTLQILSPFSAMSAQADWLFNVTTDFEFPSWWGLIEWAGLVIVGWGLVVWRRPRVRGDEPARA